MKRELMEVLIEHLPTRKEDAIKQKELSDILGIQTRLVRLLVQQARKEGYSICSTPYNGYWLSNKYQDVTETVYVLQCQVNTLMNTITDLKRANDL